MNKTAIKEKRPKKYYPVSFFILLLFAFTLISLRNVEAGNIGVGTTNPGYKLDVIGTGSFSQPIIVGSPSSASHAATKGYVDSAIGSIGGGYWSVSGSNIYNNNSGNVGIGTASPAAKLHVANGGFILSGSYGLYSSYTSDGLWGATTMPNSLSTNGNGGGRLLLGYQDNGSGLYSPAYGFEVKSTDGRPVPGQVVKAIVMKDIDNGSLPFYVNNNGSAYFNGAVTAASFSGSINSTLNAANVSSGSFGANTGGGNYSFPGRVIVGGSSVYGPLNLKQDNTTNYGGIWLESNGSTRALALAHDGSVGYITTEYSSGGGPTPLELRTWNAANGSLIRINTDGNVGIGVTSPSAKLSVAGTTRINGDFAANGTGFYFASPSSHYSPGINVPTMMIRTDDSEGGIENTLSSLVLYNANGGQNTGSNLTFASRESTSGGNDVALSGIFGWKISAGNVGGWSAGGLKFWTKNYSGIVDAMTIDNGGNVGIGTGGPESLLNVNGGLLTITPNGGSYNEGIRIHPSTANNYSSITFNAVAGTSGTGGNQWTLYTGPGVSNGFGFDNNGTTRLFLTTGGNVSIGTTNADTRLKIDAGGTTGLVVVNAESTGASELRFGSAWGRRGIYSSSDINILASSGLNLSGRGNATDLTLNTAGSAYFSGNITQGNLLGRPYAFWGVGGGSTGAVIIKLPGGAGNYGMVNMQIDTYEYNGNAATTYVCGGHNWGNRWYNYSCDKVGRSDKQIRLAFKDGQYAVVIGDASSVWSYGSVALTKITNGAYYAGTMDLGGSYTIIQEAAESYSWISENLNPNNNNADTLDGYHENNFIPRDRWFGNSNANYFGSDGNIYMAWYGNWMSNILNQDVRSGASPTFANIYTSGWYRNYGRTGMYNQDYGTHFYTDSAAYWRMSSNYGMQFNRSAANDSSIAGYVYHDGGAFGLLNNDGNWMLYSPYGSQNVYFPAWGNYITSAATHRGEGTNYVDYSRYVYNDGAYSGSGWIEPSDLGVRYANSAGSAGSASQLPTAYVGGQQTNPQVYFGVNTGLKVAMTGNTGYWSDTLWINGYAGGDVPWMNALHFSRNGEPRMWISTQRDDATSYGTPYEIISGYNIGSQSVSYANSSGSAGSAGSLSGGASASDIYNSGWFRNTNNMQGLYNQAVGAHFYASAANVWNMGGGGAYPQLIFRDNHESTIRGYVYSDGSGFGMLNNQGNWSFYTPYNTQNVIFPGTVTAGAFVYSSDQNLKQNIITIQSPLEKIMNLRGVTFNWKKDNTPSVGLIAQEVEKVFPELVTSNSDGFKGVQYGNLVAPLIEAVKEQQKEIEGLREQQKDYDLLKDRLKALEEKVGKIKTKK